MATKHKVKGITEKFMMEYTERVRKGEDYWGTYFQMVNNSRSAEKQIIPDDISFSATAATSEKVGNDSSGAMQDTQSQMLVPMYTAIGGKMVEALTAMPPRHEYEANSKIGITVRRALDKKLREVWTQGNVSASRPLAFFHGIYAGRIITQTVYKDLDRKVNTLKRDENGDFIYDVLTLGGGIEIKVYDPMTVFLDPNADASDIRGTSEYAIVTIGQYTAEGIKARYNYDVPTSNGAVGGHSPMDAYKIAQANQQGENKTSTYPVREYYLNNGEFYVIVNDSMVVDKGWASNGSADRIPLNVAPIFISPDSLAGVPFWEKVRWPIAAMSCALNQIADNNAYNNNAPTMVPQGMGIEGYTANDFERNTFVPYNPLGTNSDIQRMIKTLTVPEVTQGAEALYQKGMEQLFYVTGTNPMSFGIQDKQIRNSDVAGMVSQALVRSDSDLAQKVEVGYMNPTSWDILQIMSIHYDKFGFNEETVPKNFLKDMKSVRVVNGSYLAEDRMTRLYKLQNLIQMAMTDPSRWVWETMLYEYTEALGFPDPYIYIKSPEQMTKERLSLMALESMGEGANTEDVQKIIAQLAQLVAAGQEVQEV